MSAAATPSIGIKANRFCSTQDVAFGWGFESKRRSKLERRRQRRRAELYGERTGGREVGERRRWRRTVGGWARWKKELRIRGLMSNDGGTKGKVAGTQQPAMEGDGNAHTSTSPPPWTGCHQSGLSEGQAQSSMGPRRAATDWPQDDRGPRRQQSTAHREAGLNRHQNQRVDGGAHTVGDPSHPPTMTNDDE